MKYHDITPDELSELDTKLRYFDAGYTVPTAIERRDARIALCGYADEHESEMPETWEWLYWKTGGGYGNQGEERGRENAEREVVWFSPHCLKPATAPEQMPLVDL